MKLGENRFEINQPLADKNLFAEFAGIGGPASVFRVHTAYMRPQNVDSVDRIRFAVEDEVGRIQSNGEVREADVADHARHGGWSLLAGFHKEILTIALAMLRHCSDRFNRARIERIGRVLWNEAAMCLHLWNARSEEHTS